MKSREFLAYEEGRSYHFQYDCSEINENDPREGWLVNIFISETVKPVKPIFRYQWHVEYPVEKNRCLNFKKFRGCSANYAQAVDDIHMLLRGKGVSPMPNEHNRRTL